MDEIRKVAKAYFLGTTNENRELARETFRSFDTNGDGRISFQEFKETGGDSFFDNKLFRELDGNGDGSMDFDEFLAIFYMAIMGIRSCDNCKDMLQGNYFSCLLCLGKGNNTYDLCCKCYVGIKFAHQHSSDCFTDSHARQKLLRELMTQAQVTQTQPQRTNSDVPVPRNRSKREVAAGAIDAISTACTIGNAVVDIGSSAVSAGCCIM